MHPVRHERQKIMFIRQRIPREIRNQIKNIRPSLVRVAYSWCGSSSLADDLAQDALTIALKKHHQLREIEKFDRWIFTILNNCWREYLRKQKDTVNIDELVLLDPLETETKIADLQIIEKVRHAIAKLPNGQRQVVTLIDLQGFSYTDVAETLDIPTGTVMSRLSRARQNLKGHLLSLQQELSTTDKKLRSVK